MSVKRQNPVQKEQEFKLKVNLPTKGFRKRMFFNRFSVQKVDAHSLIIFGMIDESSVIRDTFACLIPANTLNDHRDILVGYLDNLGGVPGTVPAKWAPIHGHCDADFATVIAMAHSQGIGEICLGSFPVHAAISINRGLIPDKPIDAEAVAHLCCDLNTQRLLIAALYA